MPNTAGRDHLPDDAYTAAAGVASLSLMLPAVLAVPLLLGPTGAYTRLFPSRLYETPHATSDSGGVKTGVVSGLRPVLGLGLGLGAVAVGQAAVATYHWLRGFSGDRGGSGSGGRGGGSGGRGGRGSNSNRLTPVQAKGAPTYTFGEGLAKHVANPEGFFLLGSYLAATWIFDLMPPTYYSFEGGIAWRSVASCLLIQDALRYCAHVAEHKLSPAFYRHSHKPHHRFTNPTLFDAFDGSPADTVCMILVGVIMFGGW
jgi:hypothetical protein